MGRPWRRCMQAALALKKGSIYIAWKKQKKKSD